MLAVVRVNWARTLVPLMADNPARRTHRPSNSLSTSFQLSHDLRQLWTIARYVVFAKDGKCFGVREFTAMRMNYRLFLSLFLPVLFLLGGSAVVGGQKESSSAGRGGRWSDPATWSDKRVPAEGAAVTIGRDMEVVLDVSPPALRSLTIEGKLSFANIFNDTPTT